MQETLDEYILSHISPEDDYLYRLYRATQIHLLRPRMASGHLQGQLLHRFRLVVCYPSAMRTTLQGDYLLCSLQNHRMHLQL